MKGLKFLIAVGFFSLNLTATANASLIDRLKSVSGHDFISSAPNGCDLHLESDTEVNPPKLIYTWSKIGQHPYDYCEVEGVTSTVPCTDDFYCAEIYLLPDGNITKEDRKYFKH